MPFIIALHYKDGMTGVYWHKKLAQMSQNYLPIVSAAAFTQHEHPPCKVGQDLLRMLLQLLSQCVDVSEHMPYWPQLTE
jgi:hypothetical protein